MSFGITFLAKYFALTFKNEWNSLSFHSVCFSVESINWKALGPEASGVCTQHAGSLWSQLAAFSSLMLFESKQILPAEVELLGSPPAHSRQCFSGPPVNVLSHF